MPLPTGAGDSLSRGSDGIRAFPAAAREVRLDPDLDLACLSTFMVLAATGSYSRAADLEHLTPSAVNKRVRRLEHQVGVALVLHGGGEPELTTGGRRLAARAEALLAHAAAVSAAARAHPRDYTLRVGLPAGPRDLLGLDLDGAARCVRSSYPEARVVCVPVPYPSLRSSVVGGTVDVLITGAAVRDAAVVSTPLGVAVDRVGLVSRSHALAEAPMVSAVDLVAHPMLYNPTVPAEWMSLFYLGDVRPEREARLVPTDAREMDRVLDDVLRGAAVTTTLASLVPAFGDLLVALPLSGVAPVTLCAVRRRADRRGAVLTFVEAVSRPPADHALHRPGTRPPLPRAAHQNGRGVRP